MVRSSAASPLHSARESRFTQAKGYTFDQPMGLQEQRAAPGSELTRLGDSRMRDSKTWPRRSAKSSSVLECNTEPRRPARS